MANWKGQSTMRLLDPGRKCRHSLPELLQHTPELAIVIDNFEQKVQRPKHKDERDDWHSHRKRSRTTLFTGAGAFYPLPLV